MSLVYAPCKGNSGGIITLHRAIRQGLFGEDYIAILAGVAGLVVWRPSADVDGVDLQVRYPGTVGCRASPGIDLQVKTVTNPSISGGKLRFSGLTEKQFNRLAGDDYTMPRYLVVIIVPAETASWMTLSPDGVHMRNLAYYCSLSDQERVAEPTSRKRPVVVPLGNVLTADTLRELVTRLASTSVGS